MSERKNALEYWIKHDCGLDFNILQPMVGDASFRRYFRIHTASGSYVAMDAKPPQEDCSPYIAVAKDLRHLGLQVPEIIFAAEDQGFLLMTDFGDLTYLKALNEQNAEALYMKALAALSLLQSCSKVYHRAPPLFDSAWMWQEWNLCKEWLLAKWLNLSFHADEEKLDSCYEKLIASAIQQPQVFIHRDYHSANLMVIPDQFLHTHSVLHPEVGILDFQDAFIGPVTYDVVSLLRDCYIGWAEQRVQQWALQYWQQLVELRALNCSEQTFLRYFDLMGIQRHLKALFIFARKYIRDQQPAYLHHTPRTLNYILQTSQRYPELSDLHHYFNDVVKPALNEARMLCVP